MRRPLIAGNWKLNLGPGAAAALAVYLRDALTDEDAVDVVVFPTALAIGAVAAELDGSGVGVGVQEIAAIASGAMTGANSAVMAREAGCTWLLTGHSERRQHFAETDAGVGAKAKAGLAAGLYPIVCVGETLAERKAGRVDEVTQRQLAAALAPLTPDEVALVTIAYEPVWAIGTGETASPEQAQEVHAALRAWLRAHHPRVAETLRILYGGSVKADNARSLLGSPDIDGALVGGASLRVGDFTDIIAAAR
ncbi:MAG: triose-phosphate isomerase [Deltaproteobacteria bacterium HGW-Deltaproteobacteria-14]|jgi:triosephosphate isomerase|nr:MAG: triose-phosphate isomerase [Deltaproteobacteria bacterium HGW-Deltaproteobacteria-14]